MKLSSLLVAFTMSTVAAAKAPSAATSTTVLAHHDLTVSVYHLPPHPVTYQNSTALTFSPTAFTLIHTAHEALLIDAPATIAQGSELAAWLHATIPNKRLRGVMITHGHGDHFFSAPQIAGEFPGAQIFATRDVLEHMQQQYDADFYGSFWGTLFPGGQIEDRVIENREVSVLEEMDGKVVLEGGHEVTVVEVGQGDTYNSTVIHVPSIGLVVGGDVVYGTCHQLLVEDATPELRSAWRKSLDKVQSLCPKVVVPSHMLPGEGYAAEHVQETKRYIDVWEAERAKAGTWQELEAAMVAAFPARDGSFILRWTSQAPYDAAF
jgi:glyoxylase-like metal-dependent hydrolase (beta-lactamase superfamily II)